MEQMNQGLLKSPWEFSPTVTIITASIHLLVTILEIVINPAGQESNWCYTDTIEDPIHFIRSNRIKLFSGNSVRPFLRHFAWTCIIYRVQFQLGTNIRDFVHQVCSSLCSPEDDHPSSLSKEDLSHLQGDILQMQ